MAWNESFSGPDAGGWAGDTSFATSGPKDTESTKVAERLPVPVTISVLSSTANSDEKYILGDFPFSTVLILGNVKSYQEQDNSTMYLIGDPEDMEKDFQVINYNGISESDLSAPRFVEGTRVMALGKLRSLSDIHGIMCYGIREVTDDKEYHAFTLEARITKIYFEKNICSILRSGMGQSLSGCAAGPPVDAMVSATNTKQENVFGSQPTRIYSNTVTSSTPAIGGHGLTGQRGKIMDFLGREKAHYGDTGLSIDVIKQGVNAISMASVQTDLDFLVSEGHVYNTNTDENYALID